MSQSSTLVKTWGNQGWSRTTGLDPQELDTTSVIVRSP